MLLTRSFSPSNRCEFQSIMAQLLARRGNALISRASPRVSTNHSQLVVKCFKSGDDTEKMEKAKVTFQVPHHVEWGQELCLVGEADTLGNWDVDKCVPMGWNAGDVWTAEAELPQGVQVEYKYIVLGGEQEEKDVVEWQPCFNMALLAEKEEVTVRDVWEGDCHEVLEGTLPVPVVEPPPSAEVTVTAEAMVSAVEAAAELAPVAIAVADIAVEAEELVSHPVTTPEPSMPDVPVATAEEIASAEGAAAAAAAALSGNGNKRPQLMDSAEEEMAAHIRQPHKGAVTPKWMAEKASEHQPVPAAAAAAAPGRSFANLATSELKELCKARGLPVQGQRSELLARLEKNQE